MIQFKMDISQRLSRLILLCQCLIVMLSCSGDDPDGESGKDSSSTKNSETIAVRLDVENSNTGRAFVTDNDLPSLCSPAGNIKPCSPEDVSERVGLYTDIAFKGDNYVTNASYMKDCMGYFPYKEDKNSEWHYYSPYEDELICDDSYWIGGTKMICVAFFPFNYIMQTKMVEPNRHAYDFELSYKTLFTQKDVIAGFTIADSDTRTDDKNNPLPNGNTVPILMKHVVSAVKFQFRRHADEMEDKLTGCWLETNNKVQVDVNFAIAGTLSFEYKQENGNYIKSLNWKTIPASANNVFYKWEVPDMQHAIIIPENNSGTDAASAYTGTNKITENQMYCDNDGFLMLIPQVIPENLYLCFTTQNGGPDLVIRKKLSQPDIQGMPLEWEPNNRYTYTITLSKAGIVWHVDVSDWNDIESNYSADF